jgi:hypothetical protein
MKAFNLLTDGRQLIQLCIWEKTNDEKKNRMGEKVKREGMKL